MSTISCVSFIAFMLYSSFSLASSINTNTTQTFILYVSKLHKPAVFSSDNHWYSSILASLPPSPHHATILYTYSHTIYGFSAHLTHDQAAELTKIPGIISVVPARIHRLHTTRTPQFLGLSSQFGLWPNGAYGEDIIIDVLDSGVWPGHPSFSDTGMSDVPKSWRGTCETSDDFPASSCNKKLIGARVFSFGFQKYIESQGKQFDPLKYSLSPRDKQGHGTHVATIAAGSSVQNAGFYQYAKGEARGMALKSRIASYNVCWRGGCADLDILAAIDQAIKDGVHVISMSFGGRPYPYYTDSKTIGVFGATKHGVIVSSSAGNSGPYLNTVSNVAPWIITVGASTIDREFRADVVLGDGTTLRGASLYTGQPLPDKQFPLMYAGYAGDRLCSVQLDPSKVRGKIVVCENGEILAVEKVNEVKRAGGVGMIVLHVKEDLVAHAYLLPATLVGLKDGKKVRDYVKSSSSPTGKIVFRGTVFGDSSSPKVAAFSSRGPNKITPEILKPDVIAPGVNILAGWSGDVSPSEWKDDSRRVEFNIVFGTSMACPHVSGIAAVLKNAYPDWSPAAIKSAIVTTAYDSDVSGKIIVDTSSGEASTPFERGAGHVNPNAALDPGLVYEIDTDGYISFLCAIGYTDRQMAKFLQYYPPPGFCGQYNLGSPGNINYPTFSVVFKGSSSAVTHKRTVKNVGKNVDAV